MTNRTSVTTVDREHIADREFPRNTFFVHRRLMHTSFSL
jgi:hypothetical protein